MTQLFLTWLIIALCTLWLAYRLYRLLARRPGKGLCGGSCCDTPKSPEAPSSDDRTVFISSDDLARRVRARR